MKESLKSVGLSHVVTEVDNYSQFSPKGQAASITLPIHKEHFFFFFLGEKEISLTN